MQNITEHYLDNSSTTKPSETALAAMNSAALVWGNPSSTHTPGMEAASLLRDSRISVSRALGIQRFAQDRLVFTSSGTEANNIAMLGCARAKNRTKNGGLSGVIIISDGEHPSIANPAALLENEGYTVVKIPTRRGVLDLGALAAVLKNAPAPVIFAAFMLVNNETGAVYDVKSAAAMVKSAYPDAVVHCDAVQGFMKMKFTPYSLGVDSLTVSAHKIHATRGAAALFISSEVIKRKNIVPVMPGGGQEGGFRSGTENLCAVSAFAAACNEEKENFDKNRETVRALRDALDARLCRINGITYNKPEGDCLPDICNIILPGVRSETMLNFLSGRRIYISAGSACSASSKKKSAALTAFGTPDDNIDSSVRISLSHTNNIDDINALADALEDGISTLQKKK